MLQRGLSIWAVCLAGCGGGGGDGPADVVTSFDDRLAAFNRLPVTAAADLPTMGNVQYAGQVKLRLPIAGTTSDYIGALGLTVDFARPTDVISGQIDQLQSGGDGLSGTLDLTNGRLDRMADPDTDFQFEAELEGTLVGGGVTYQANGELYGDFRDVDAGSATGLIAGTLDSVPDGVVLFDGAFVAEAE